MGVELGLAELLREAKEIRDSIGTADDVRQRRLDAVERSVNELYLKANRPGLSGAGHDDIERKDAIEFCRIKHELSQPKNDGLTPVYTPSSSEIEDAALATKALHSLFRHGNVDRVEHKKSLSSFSFGSNQFILAPEMSNRVLSCLVDPTDVAGLMGQETTSSGSLKFLIDNTRMGAAWACESSCFANNPQPDLQDGLGELEIKVETLRYVVCATSDLLQDSSFNVEAWVLRKASNGFRDTINAAVIAGDGIGKPLGVLHPSAGIPICETSPATQPGMFTWQDCVMLAYEVPMQYHAGASFLLNQRTWALMMTMSDASGRPLWNQMPGAQPSLTFAGFPVHIVTWMPDVQPGAVPIAFGNWRETYMVVTRQATMMRPDPYSAGFCTLFRFEARVGGAVLCGNAARLLRIR